MLKRTYSSRKTCDEMCQEKLNHQKDTLFTEVVLKGNNGDASSPYKSHKQPRVITTRYGQVRHPQAALGITYKTAGRGVLETSKKGKKKLDKQENLDLFSYDSEEEISTVVTECTHKFNDNALTKPAFHTKACTSNYNDSIEIARDYKEYFGKQLRIPEYSPHRELVTSNDGSKDYTFDKKNYSLEETWVTISSDNKGSRSQTDTESNKKTISSKYTYTYVSTYTDASTSNQTLAMDKTSPQILIKKLNPKLNSTTYWNKDDIGTVLFPDSLSPIGHIDSTVKTNNKEKFGFGQDMDKRKEKDTEPKCSTQLFLTNTLSSQTKEVFPDISLSQICHASKTNETVSPAEIIDSVTLKRTSHSKLGRLSESHDLKTDHNKTKKTNPVLQTKSPYSDQKDKNNVFKSSTPQNLSVTMMLTLSPIKSPDFDEYDLPLITSTEVNTDEIIVPSFHQPSFSDPEVYSDDNGKKYSSPLNSEAVKKEHVHFVDDVLTSTRRTSENNPCNDRAIHKHVDSQGQTNDVEQFIHDDKNTSPVALAKNLNDNCVVVELKPSQNLQCSACLACFNTKWMRNICLISKLCSCSQFKLQDAQHLSSTPVEHQSCTPVDHRNSTNHLHQQNRENSSNPLHQ